MIGRNMVNSMYDDLVKEIEKYHNDYKTIVKLIFGEEEGLRYKLCDAYILSGEWPGVAIPDGNSNTVVFKIDAEDYRLYVNGDIWVDTILTDGTDFSIKEHRKYGMDYIDKYIVPLITNLDTAKCRLLFVKNHLFEIRKKLDAESDRVLEKAIHQNSKIYDRLHNLSKYDLIFEKFDI